jgi:hypothetical protein
MAARKNLSHDQRTREKIQTSQLVNRLQSFANGKIELSRDQIKAIEVLLKKSLPDLSAVELSGTMEQNVTVRGALAWQPPQ